MTATRRAALATTLAAVFTAGAAPAPKGAAARARWPAAPGDMNLGNPNAPVRVVEYLSLSCSHCATFNSEVFPAFRAKYIDTGRVYYTARELLTQPAQIAAAGFLLARCGDGSKYFPIVDQVLRSQTRWRPGERIAPIFIEIAKANGFTEAQFNACVTDEAANVALEKRVQYAVETDKVDSTPTFFVNGVRLDSGHVPTLAELDVAIARALKATPAQGRR
ncbi:thioredoxin domain-containing protein [uncultured Phenylobacterium sp.]|uniref:thioredoxin domain-containing protein n=1 Tax=uncultured Phenylobacterium sp. TaxID=349273 RepID=UPI0025E4C9C7|nr:thioredoxin domain-containing protein [uncultured Phenylobacterium sp.]